MVNYRKIAKNSFRETLKEPPVAVGLSHAATVLPAKTGNLPYSSLTLTNVLPHELSHAATAVALGGSVEEMYLGPSEGYVAVNDRVPLFNEEFLEANSDIMIHETPNGNHIYIYEDSQGNLTGASDISEIQDLPLHDGTVLSSNLGSELTDIEKFAVSAMGPVADIALAAAGFWVSRKSDNPYVKKLAEGHAAISTLTQLTYPLKTLWEKVTQNVSNGDFQKMQHYLEQTLGVSMPVGTMEILFMGLYAIPAAYHLYSKHKTSQANIDAIMEDNPRIVENFSASEEESEIFLEIVSQNATNISDLVLLQDDAYDVMDTIDAGSYGRVLPYDSFDSDAAGISREKIDRFRFEKEGEQFIYLEGLLRTSYSEILDSRDENWFDENASEIKTRWNVDLIRPAIFFRRRKSPTPYKDAAHFLTMYSEGFEISEIADNLDSYREMVPAAS